MVSHTNFDATGDLLENFIWGQSFAWGNLKHPPLVGWVTGAWFTVMPRTPAAYHALAYANAAIGMLGVYALARQLKPGPEARAACLLLALTLPFSSLAGKFNANTILLSLWPWIAVSWLASLNASGKRSWLFAVLLGILAAAAVLGKYYSGVFFLALFALTVGLPEGRAWFKQPAPWIAMLTGLGMLAPHANWLQQNDFAPFYYVQSQGSGEFELKQFVKFVAAPFVYTLPAFVACLYVVPGFQGARFWRAWLPQDRQDILFYLALLPYLFTLAFGVTGFVSLSSPWAIPLVFALPLLWLRNLSCELSDEERELMQTRTQNVFMGFLCLVLLLSPVYAWYQGHTGEDNYYLPLQEAVYETEVQWFERMTGEYRWVAGDYQDAGAVAFYGSTEAEFVYQLPRVPRSSGLVFCHLGKAEEGVRTNFCTQRAERWSKAREDRVTKIEFTVMKEGARFPEQIPHVYRVYFYQQP